MQLTSNPTFFAKEENDSLGFEGLVNSMNKGMNYANTATKFYQSANDIIKLFNSYSLSSNSKYAKKLAFEKSKVDLDNTSLRDISDNVDSMASVMDKITGFIKNDPDSKDMAPHIESRDILLKEIGRHREMQANLEASMASNSKIKDPDNKVPEATKYTYFENFRSAIDDAFDSGKYGKSDFFTPQENEIIKNTAVAGDTIQRIQSINSASPTFMNSIVKTQLTNQLRRSYNSRLTPKIKSRVYYELYKKDVEEGK